MSCKYTKNVLVLNKNKKLLSGLGAVRFSSYNTGTNAESLRGIYPSLTIPFKRMKNEDISWENLEKNLIRWSTVGFSGYSVHGFYGEYPYLSNKERFDLVKMIRDIVGKQKTIIAGSSCESLNKTIEICELMKKCGANYSMIFTPHYYKNQMTYSVLLDYFTKIADKSPLPIIISNMPSVTFIDLPAELIIDLSEHPNIVGLKECSHNIAKIACITEAIKQRSDGDFSILCGSASFLLDGLRVGATGCIAALANVLGPQLVELYSTCLYESGIKSTQEKNKSSTRRNIDKAQILQDKLISPDLAITEMYGVAGLKAAMDAFGYYGGPCRLPLPDLTEHELNMVKIEFEKSGFNWKDSKTQNQYSLPMSS